MEEDLLAIKLRERITATQQGTQRAVRKAITVNRESRKLLQLAKRGGEIAIEQNEKTALSWMENELSR